MEVAWTRLLHLPAHVKARAESVSGSGFSELFLLGHSTSLVCIKARLGGMTDQAAAHMRAKSENLPGEVLRGSLARPVCLTPNLRENHITTRLLYWALFCNLLRA